MVRQYETTFIVDAHLPTEKIDESIDKFLSFIEKKGGKIHHVDRWGKRRLAYEIRKKQYGYYVYLRFESEGEFIKVLEREYKLDDSILRYLTVLVPKMVIHEEAEKALKKEHEATIEAETEENDKIEDVQQDEVVKEESPVESDEEKKDSAEGEGDPEPQSEDEGENEEKPAS